MAPRRPDTLQAAKARMAALVQAALPCSVLGREHVASGAGAFLIANHRSMADAAVLYLTFPRPLAGPAKAELFRVPVLGGLLRGVGGFPVDRDGMDYRAARTVADVYRRGGTVLVFPEGHRSQTPALLPFSANLARLIIKLEAPLIPAGIAGTENVLPPGGWILRLSPVAVAYAEPFELSEFYGRPLTPMDSQRAAEIMRERVADALTQAEVERNRLLASAPRRRHH